jgi:hypothetical protein
MLGDLAYSPGFLSKLFVGDFRPKLFEFRRRRLCLRAESTVFLQLP